MDFKKGKFKGLGELLSNIAPEHGLFDFLDLVKNWATIVGKLSDQTTPLRLSYGALIVATKHPSFSHALSFMDQAIIKKIEKSFPSLKGKIKSMRYEVNISAVETQMTFKKNEEDKKMTYHPHAPHIRKYRALALEIFKDVEDKELLEDLISIYIQMQQP